MKIEVESIAENEDGSAVFVVNVDEEALVALAKVGLVAALEEAAANHGHTDTKGAGDAPSGEDGDPPVYGEFPGF